MKRVVSVILVLLMVGMPAFVFADEPGTVVIGVGVVEATEPGGTVSVPVYIASEEGYMAHCLRMRVLYDPACLTVTSVTSGEAWNEMPDDCMKIRTFHEPGVVNLALLCPSEPMTAVGCLVYINFIVSEDAPEAMQLIVEVNEFFISELPDSVAVDLPYIAVNGGIEVHFPSPYKPGDANCDGSFNYSDITDLYLYMLGVSDLTEQGRVNGDMDGDGAITFNDISEASIYLLGA